METIQDRLLRLNKERDSLRMKIRSGWYDPVWFETAVARIYDIEREIEADERYLQWSKKG